MSAESFRVGDPIDGQVAKKIQSLQNTFGSKDDGQSRRNYIELQSAIPWIRMQSGVSLTEDLATKYRAAAGYDLAKKYVLFGLNRRIESAEGSNRTTYNPNFGDPIGYDYDSQFGFGHRPKPGIVDMNIHSHNRFGSLRTAVIRFQCWTRDQIDALEILYMRPGYSVLLEWGHSKILRTDESGVIDMDLGIDLYEDGLDTATEIRKRVLDKRTDLHYGYDAILGVIKNFSWQVRPDGGYDCTTHLVTTGEIIESYKANFYLKQELITEDLKKAYKESLQDSFTKEIIWPVLYKDNGFKKEDIPELGEIEAKIDQWVSQAQQSAKLCAEAITTYSSTASGEALRDRLKQVLGTAIKEKVTANNAKSVADSFAKVINAIGIVKGAGAGKLYNQERSVYYTDGITNSTGMKPVHVVTLFHTQKKETSLTVQSPWKWLVDFNEVGNNFGAGQEPNFNFPGGARASWMFDDIVEGSKLCTEILTTLDVDYSYNQGNNINPIFTVLAEAFNLMKAVRANKDEYKFEEKAPGNQLFYFDGSTEANAQGTGIYLETGETREKFFENLKNQVAVSEVSKETGISTSSFDYNIIAKDTINSKDEYGNDAVRTDGEVEIGARWLDLVPADAKYPIAENAKVETKTVSTTLPPGTARFAVAKWTGFNPVKAAQGQVITAVDEQTGETFAYYDPNDDYTSKLHYYLRTKLHTPYHKEYLNQDLSARSFTEVFQYRSSPAGLVEDLFNIDKAPTKRNTVPKDVKDGLQFVLGGRFFSDQDLEIRDHVYIKLGALLELINKHMLRSDSEYFFTFQTTYSQDRYPKYFTFDDHISIDPRICILPHTALGLNITGRNSLGTPKILDIELSVNYILDTLNRYITSEGKVAVYDYLQDILDGVVKATGGVNDYQLQYMEDNAVYHIVDRRVIAPNGIKAFENSRINVYGLNSIIQDVNLVSKLTPKITSMIAIAAQDNPFTSMDEGTGFNAINRGMTDRIYAKRYDIESKESQDGKFESYQKFRDQLKSDIIGLITHLGFFYSKNTVPRNSADTQYGVYENYCKFLLGGKTIFEHSKGRATYNFILPFELQFRMYGISGLKVMDAFLIDQTILPKTYGGDADKPVGFLITGVEHSVNRSEWTTNIKSQIFNIGDDQQTDAKFTDLKEDFIEAVKTLQFDNNAGGSPGETENLDKGWEGKEQPFAYTYLTYEQAGRAIAAVTTSKNLQVAVLAVMIKEQGSGDQIRGFNHNYGGYDITGGGWAFSAFGEENSNGFVYATEGGTKRRKAFVSFVSVEAFMKNIISKFEDKGFANASTGDAVAKTWYEKWNGYGAKNLLWKPNVIISGTKERYKDKYPTEAQFDAYVLKNFADNFYTKAKTAIDNLTA